MRFTILSLFLSLSFCILAIVYIAQQDFIEKMSQASASEQFNVISAKLNERLQNLDKYNMVYMDIFLSELQNKSLEDVLKNQKRYLKMYSAFLGKNNSTYSVYMGDKNDKFFEVINLNTSEVLRKKYNATKDDRWLTLSIDENSSYKTLILYDKNLNQTSKTMEKTSYKPSKRPWFIWGMETTEKIKKSDPYMFGSINAKGFTYLGRFGEGLVFCVDMLMSDMDKILVDKDFSLYVNSHIINANGKVIASSNNKIKILNEILKDLNLQKTNSHYDKKNINNIKYAYKIQKINSDFIISIANLTAISKVYRDDFKKSALVTLILSMLLLPTAWFMASFVVSPILKLTKENEKIAKRDFKSIEKVDSKISEISQLSNSMYNMANSIKNHNSELERKVNERTKELKKLSVTDKLTGVYNRIKIDESLEAEVLRQNRYGRKFGIIIMDIDFFKKVNDKHGHQAGDDVLKEFADILKKGVRKTDVVGRWGGEEFIIICIEVDLLILLKLAEKLRLEIEQTKFSHVGNKTASFGVALREKNEKIEQFISRADLALYLAKNNGRNRVEAG